jgi:hypothetical protein
MRRRRLEGEAEISADERRGIGHVSPYAEGLSGGGQGAAVEDVLGAGDGAGAVGDEEGDEFGGVVGLCRSAERDAAEGVHDLLKGGVPADTGAAGDAVDQAVCAVGLYESGGDRVDADPSCPTLLARPLL